MRFAAFCRSSWFFLSGLALVACGGGGGGGSGALPDRDGPGLVEITPVPAWGNDATPSYTFRSDEEGTIAYLGACVSTTTTIVKGENTITLEPLVDGLYDSCRVSVSDKSGNSVELAITPFTIDTVAPTLSQKVAVPTPTNDTTPAYTFTTSEAGAISYGGACSSALSTAVAGDNAITLAALSEGSYSSCSIQLTDAAGNVSALTLNAFVIDTTAPTLSQKVPVPTPTNDTTPAYTFTTSEAGAISYGGACSSALSTAVAGDNAITLAALSEGSYSSCSIQLTDAAGNVSALTLNAFVIDTTAPTLSQKVPVPTPTNDTTPAYTFTASEAGVITYDGGCSSSITTAQAGDNTLTLSALSAGTYEHCTLQVADAAGNVSELLEFTAFVIEGFGVFPQVPAPVLTPGLPLKISGWGFHDVAIRIDGEIVDFELESSHELTVILPVLPAGDYALEIFAGETVRSMPVAVKVQMKTVNMSVGVGGAACAIQEDQTISCWGEGSNGELGNGVAKADYYSLVPVSVTGIAEASQLSLGYQYGCSVVQDGSIHCWGNNDYGQLGDGTQALRSTPVAVEGVANAIKVAAGVQHTCALLADKTLTCWGKNDAGQLGNGTFEDSNVPVAVANINNAADVVTGSSHSCALLDDKTVKCWGMGTMLGNGGSDSVAAPVMVNDLAGVIGIDGSAYQTCVILEDQTVQCWGQISLTDMEYSPVTIPGIDSAISLGIGLFHGCALLADGGLGCWGSNNAGELGTGSFLDSSGRVTGIDTAVSVAAGFSRTCATLADKTMRCWGKNERGGLGIQAREMSSAPVTLGGIADIEQMTFAINGYGCSMKKDHTVWCWGSGSNERETSLLPLQMPGIVDALEIQPSCALLQSGKVVCWGENYRGELGNGSFGFESLVPVEVLLGGPAIGLSTADGGSCAVMADHGVRCWGNGVSLPQAVPGIDSAVAISKSVQHACVLLEGRTVKCWGDNTYGQLGDGSKTNSLMPVPVSGITTATAIAVGGESSCALLIDHTIKCWGAGLYGQLGDGMAGDSIVPVQVGDMDNAESVSVGVNYACALLLDKTVKCWGMRDALPPDGVSPQLDALPVAIEGLRNVVRISVMGATACAVLADGYVQCWGSLPELVIKPIPSAPVYSR